MINIVNFTNLHNKINPSRSFVYTELFTKFCNRAFGLVKIGNVYYSY